MNVKDRLTGMPQVNTSKGAERHPEKRRNPDRPQPRRPEWLRVKAPVSAEYAATRSLMREHNLVTVCEEAACPNIGECWAQKHATMMILGSVCTRACAFCNVATGRPDLLDPHEPENVGAAVSKLALRHVVITSVDRDDLDDGGAGHFAETVREVKKLNPYTGVEALTPDFLGLESAIDVLLESGLDVFAQNVETVKRLTHPVRDPRAGYEQTLNVLKYAAEQSDVITKTSLMLGLGETDDELLDCMDDLREADVDVLTLGQYLQPTSNHLPVERFVTPDEFERYREWGLEKGFREVVSGVFVRSSYRAERVLEFNNVGLQED